MKRLSRSIIGTLSAVLLTTPAAFASEPAGGPADYSGITGIYYTLIAIILIWGVYDTFFRKA